MGVALGQPGVFGGVEAGVHTGEDGKMAARRQRQRAFVAEKLDIGLVGVKDSV